jgi:hypothetical protein
VSITPSTAWQVARLALSLTVGAIIGGYSGAHHWFLLGLVCCFVAGVAIGFIPDLPSKGPSR